MKSLILYLSLFVVAFIPLNQTSDFDASEVEQIVTIDDMNKAISADIAVTPCSGSVNNASDLCSCIAAGSCSYDQKSKGCRIEFCSDHVETGPEKTAPSNITKIKRPCEEG
jgi:hypothetical protein